MNIEREPLETITAFTIRRIRAEIIEECAKAVEDIPASASPYEDVSIAKAVIAFKKFAVSEIRELMAANSDAG